MTTTPLRTTAVILLSRVALVLALLHTFAGAVLFVWGRRALTSILMQLGAPLPAVTRGVIMFPTELAVALAVLVGVLLVVHEVRRRSDVVTLVVNIAVVALIIEVSLLWYAALAIPMNSIVNQLS
ncbi:hypothetical protein [Deinococcus pimensis]|uniref:hypothetical protein n=1 Tax=Deinococcus pimensis TaxID=309888 RepID=UPI00048A029A|nr:hypothetical protein [Deinococcus pimensis]